jgi:hypothetical protein
MSDEKKCPTCGVSLREEAKFCDGCGRPVAPEAIQATAQAMVTAGAKPKANWTMVVIVLVLVVAAGWLLFGPKGGAKVPDTGDGMPASPHGAGMMGGDTAANPHGEQQGMESLTQTLASAKTKLEEDPLDRDALMTLYQNYGMIGRAPQLRPYLDKAIAMLETKSSELGDKLIETGMNVGLAALLGNELDGARAVYAKLNELKPGQPEVILMLGDVSAALDQFEDAIKYYDEYMALGGLEQNDQYWSAVVNRSVAQRMRYEKAEPGKGQPAWLNESIAGLEQAAAAKPELYAPLYNLGLAYGLAGQKDKALASYEKARPLAKDDMEKWQVDAEVAKLKGETPPPQPALDSMGGMEGMGGMDGTANPHGGAMGSGEGGGMVNPHGGMGGAGGGASNPHGGMGGS